MAMVYLTKNCKSQVECVLAFIMYSFLAPIKMIISHARLFLIISHVKLSLTQHCILHCFVITNMAGCRFSNGIEKQTVICEFTLNAITFQNIHQSSHINLHRFGFLLTKFCRGKDMPKSCDMSMSFDRVTVVFVLVCKNRARHEH
jgi:hypothetical protein